MADPLTDDQRTLVVDFLPTALAIGKAFAYKNPGWLEDLQGAAQLGLCHAARTYDGSIPFPIWAAFRTRKALVREMARLARGPEGFADEDDPRAIPGDEPPPDQAAADREEAALLAVAIGRLHPVEAFVVRERHGLGQADRAPRTLADVGREAGISAVRAHQIERVALTKLRNLLN